MPSASTARSSRSRAAPPVWAGLPERELLNLRLRDLNVSLRGTRPEACLTQLNRELTSRKLAVRAHAWISSEWFSPDNTPGISIPFYLTHPRLARLERKMVRDVEGGTHSACMNILRHEAGHIIQHSFNLHRRRRWQNLFGRSSEPYPDYYRPDPRSRDYVQHLELWYAQSHPDEDFAETFAVWLAQPNAWRRKYADWPALAKLEYVDELMKELAGEKPVLTDRVEVDPLSKLTMTLGEHYTRKRELYDIDAPSVFDTELKRIFRTRERASGTAPAATVFIRENRPQIRRQATKSSNEHGAILDAVLADVVRRCRELDLRAEGSARQIRTDLARMLARRNVHSLYSTSRRQWFAV